MGLDLEATGAVERSNALVEGGRQRPWCDLFGRRIDELPADPAVASSSPNGDSGDPRRFGVVDPFGVVDLFAIVARHEIDGDRTDRLFVDRCEQHEPGRGVELSTQAIGIGFQQPGVEEPHDSKPVVGARTAE